MVSISDLVDRRSFRLPDFELVPLDFSTEVTAELAELLLDQPIPAAESSSRVVPFRAATATPGEMRESIERHLESKPAGELSDEPASPAEELRLALAELRRSLG